MPGRRLGSFFALLTLITPICGCYGYLAARTPGGWNKMAIAKAEPDFTPPSNNYSDFVRWVGQEKFVDEMARRCSDTHHLYALGWYGAIWHLDVVADHLDSDDERTSRMALAAFKRLTNEHFESNAAALRWWSEHKHEFPRWAGGKKDK